MKRFIVFGMMLPGLLLLLAGCHSDKKQADSIYEELKKSASYEKDFVANQEKLDQYKSPCQNAISPETVSSQTIKGR
ncbi:hypothetical protein P9759_13835 [Heyndrickxia coagulans]|uniref:hypothetical protein n=1 Tax=Heyndrickxia coagulans TaxID=1398 RepID=UPI002E21386F|nr:hypothetical protein [Heyndrickxia coagulans]